MRRCGCLLALGLSFLVVAGCGEREPEGEGRMGQVSGRILAPLEGATLYVYKKGMDLYGPAFAVSRATGPDGSFDLRLPAGDYVAMARKRQNGDTSGPVVAGDNKSEILSFTVAGDDQTLTVVAPIKSGDERRLTDQALATATGLSGTISDADGNPVEGARVHVYDHVQMSERPKYVSEKTGPDGRYLVYLPEGGTYYLAARDKFGGPPKLGDLYGRYDQGTIEPSAVVVRSKEILQGVDIRVTKVW
ncbi:MAG: hypothetical protein A2X84_01615 [Desulfuromonadaceae bacterium GWC2_58_13]|nr:MAG: hypothetical protein A2X84_01615 [Desulfuromonadaceae bacterium GWC2_58_13]